MFNPYEIRKDIDEGDSVHCLAFTWPLMHFSSDDDDSDQNQNADENSQQLQKEYNPSTVKAKKKWKRLYEYIFDKRKQIPLKQMALKAKHEYVLYQQIEANLAKGKSIDEERRLLATLDENMKFKGCPTDRAYAKKVGRPLHLLKTQAF